MKYHIITILLLNSFVSYGVSQTQVEMRTQNFHNYNNEDLYTILDDDNMKDLSAQALIPEAKPSDWANSCVYREFVKIVWIAYGIADNNKSDSNITDIINRVPQQTAEDCLLKMAAFSELCKRNENGYLELYLTNRSCEESTLLDVCIAGKIVWGDLLPVFPTNTSMVFAFSEHPLPPEKWCFHNNKMIFWLRLYKGNNEVYRMLAVDCFDIWADSSIRKDFEQNGWKFDNPHIIRKWLHVVEALPTDEQIAIYNSALTGRMVLESMDENKKQWVQHLRSLVQSNLKKAREQQLRDKRKNERREILDKQTI